MKINYNIIIYSLLFFLLERSLGFDIRIYALTPSIFIERDNLILYKSTSFFMMLIVALLLPKKFEKPSDLFLHIQFLFPILPMLVLFARFDLSFIYMVSVLFAYILIIVLVNVNIKIKINQSPSVYRIHYKLLINYLMVIVFLTIAYLYVAGVGRFFNLNFDLVYEFRGDIADSMPGISGYLVALVTKAIIPSIVVFGCISRRYFAVGYAFFSSILLFGLTSHKAILFYPMVSFFVYIYFTKLKLYMLAVAVIILLMISEYGLSLGGGLEWLYFLLVDRTIFVPSAINFSFYDWFSNDLNPFMIWSDSKITLGMISPPYDISTPSLIGFFYYGDEKIIANTGWIGSGLSHLGVSGLFIYAFIMGVIFKNFNNYSEKLGKRIVSSLCISALLSPMLSTDLPNGILTHGVLITLFILYIVDKKTIPQSVILNKLR